MAASGTMVSKTIDLRGANAPRTSASNAAYAALDVANTVYTN